MRTLAGFTVHPNVGAALLVGDKTRCGALMRKLRTAPYQALLPHCRIDVLEMTGDFNNDLISGEKKLRRMIQVSSREDKRTKQPLSKLCLALQCGGSDAFSGVSGNPLAGSVARELIRHGGVAVQAETDELMGAEQYFLRRCRKGQASRFLKLVERFKRRLANHGRTSNSLLLSLSLCVPCHNTHVPRAHVNRTEHDAESVIIQCRHGRGKSVGWQ